MSHRSIVYIFSIIVFTVFASSQDQPSRITLPNGWSLTPAGMHIPLGDLPLTIAVSHSKKMLVVTNNGQS